MTEEKSELAGPTVRNGNQNSLKKKSLETKQTLESMLSNEITRLSQEADVCIFALYDAECPNEGPIDFSTHERDSNLDILDFDVDFDFEGIGVWYICRRYGKTYRLRHILVQIRQGRFVKGQVEEFEGFWDEFPEFVVEDRWIKGFTPIPPPLPKLVETALAI